MLKIKKFMENRGLILNMAKGVFAFLRFNGFVVCFCVFDKVSKVLKCLFFQVVWAFGGVGVAGGVVAYFRLFGFGRFCVFVFLVFRLLFRFCFCLFCFVFVLLMDCFWFCSCFCFLGVYCVC